MGRTHGHDKKKYEAKKAKEKKKEDDYIRDFSRFAGMTAKDIEKDLDKDSKLVNTTLAKLVISMGGVIETAHEGKDKD